MRPGPVLLSIALCGGLACDSLSTEARQRPEVARFILSEGDAKAFAEALQDVRMRVLPTLADIEGSSSLYPLMAELSDAIAGRDQSALRSVLARTQSAITALDRGDTAVGGAASELDVLRLILDQAHPLASDQIGPVSR
jgi:hypothetical protein